MLVYDVLLLTILLPYTFQYPTRTEYKDGPLILTPYIESNNLEEGRKLAQVNDFEWNGVSWNKTSYSGLLTVNKDYGSNMFFWYFPAERNPTNVPVLVWLNGYSTASSYGVFLQNGPYDLNHGNTLVPRNTSWQKYYHVIYIDNPVGVGFSYTESEDGYTKTFDQLMDNLYSVLEQFFQLFPELVSHDLYITGLSMGGKYVTSFAYKIFEKQKFNLKGIFLGNPLLDLNYQLNVGDYLLQLGFVDKKQEEKLNEKVEIDKKALAEKDYQKFYDLAVKLLIADDSYIVRTTGVETVYNYFNPYIDTTYYDQFINSNVIKEALHVENMQFNDGSKAMAYASKIYGESVVPYLEAMVEKINMLFYVGQLDIVCAYPMVVDVLSSVKWSGQSDYLNADRSKLYEKDGSVWGYIRNYKTLTDVLVRRAGHSAITDKPDEILGLLFNLTKYDQFIIN